MNLQTLREAARSCRGCELYRDARQVVFGQGTRKARAVLIGEMPGDREDREGRPFVGPAGRLLDAAMSEAGLDRQDVYLTNVVKHFRWEPHGRLRLHKSPTSRQVEACKPWLHAEILVLKPRFLACLGAVAAKALLGSEFRITRQRGELHDVDGTPVVATHHPAAILRTRDAEDRRRKQDELVGDLQLVAAAL